MDAVYDPVVHVVNYRDEIIDSFDSEESYEEYMHKCANVITMADAVCEYFEHHNKNLTKTQEHLIDDLSMALGRGVYNDLRNV